MKEERDLSEGPSYVYLLSFATFKETENKKGCLNRSVNNL